MSQIGNHETPSRVKIKNVSKHHLDIDAKEKTKMCLKPGGSSLAPYYGGILDTPSLTACPIDESQASGLQAMGQTTKKATKLSDRGAKHQCETTLPPRCQNKR